MKVRDLIAKLQEMDPELPVTHLDMHREYTLLDDDDLEVVDCEYGGLIPDPDGKVNVWVAPYEGSHLRIG